MIVLCQKVKTIDLTTYEPKEVYKYSWHYWVDYSDSRIANEPSDVVSWWLVPETLGRKFCKILEIQDAKIVEQVKRRNDPHNKYKGLIYDDY